MHTRCVHTTPATRTARSTLEFSPAHRALPGGARAASTLHATPAVLRTGAHPHRHGKQLSRGELPGLQRASRAGGESARGPAWDPAEALRGASAQCCPSPGADRPEVAVAALESAPSSRGSGRRSDLAAEGARRESGRRRFLDFLLAGGLGPPPFFSPLSCFLQSFLSVLDFGANVRNLSGLAPIPHLCERI